MSTDTMQETELEAAAQQALAADPPEDHEAREPWRIEDDDGMEWALRKLRAAQAERARIAARAQANLDRISAWAVSQDAGPARDEDYFRAQLERYARDQRAKGRSRISTPQGDLSTKPGHLSFKVTDLDAAIAWLTEHAPDLVRTKTSREVNVAGLKKVAVEQGGTVFLKDLGADVPGVQAEWGQTTVKIEPVGGVDPEDAGDYTAEAGAE